MEYPNVFHSKTIRQMETNIGLKNCKCLHAANGGTTTSLPSDTAIAQDWPMIIIDLKDCLFNIPLSPQDRPFFMFSVPNINFREPERCFQWTGLPQRMANSATLCQLL